MSETKAHFDETKANAFLDKVFKDISGTYTSLMCCIGDRLDLFKKLETEGPLTITELSKIAGINERYSKEWLNVMACAGYLGYDPPTQQYRLPPDYAPVLTEEGGPMFASGLYQSLFGEIKNMEKLIEVFKKGGGIPLKDFDENEFAGTERTTASWFENLLLQEWIPVVPDVKSKLEKYMVDPRSALRAIRQALKPDGTYLWLEINSKDRLEDNYGAMGALFYGWSIMYCMTTSLAEGGEGLGTLGMPPSIVKKYCDEAGFSDVRKLPLDNPFNILYEVKP
jgi:hypothetical protein